MASSHNLLFSQLSSTFSVTPTLLAAYPTDQVQNWFTARVPTVSTYCVSLTLFGDLHVVIPLTLQQPYKGKIINPIFYR